jgi:hypothetical protein
MFLCLFFNTSPLPINLNPPLLHVLLLLINESCRSLLKSATQSTPFITVLPNSKSQIAHQLGLRFPIAPALTPKYGDS